MHKQPVTLAQTKKLFYEDNFANAPQLSLVWPTAPRFGADSYAIQVLSMYLTEGKKAPFYQVLVEEKKLTDQVSAMNYNSERAGQLIFTVRAYENVRLDSVQAALNNAFARFEKQGISESDLRRIKALIETEHYNNLSSVEGKAFALAQYQIFTGDPGFANQDLARKLGVTVADVKRVYDRYIKGKPVVATSFVPKGQANLVLSGSVPAPIEEEKIIDQAEPTVDPSIQANYPKTPSSFDRSQEPPYGKAPQVTTPPIWQTTQNNGLKVYGIEDHEIPLVEVRLTIKGGHRLDSLAQPGVAHMLAQMLTKGTKTKTAQQLEEAMTNLGTIIKVQAEAEQMILTFSALARNYEAVMELVTETLISPRWDEKEFELVRQSVLSQIKQQKANPNAIAGLEFNKILYGSQNILSQNILGSEASVQAVTLGDLQRYYASFVSPSVSNLHLLGALTRQAALKGVAKLSVDWAPKPVELPQPPSLVIPTQSKVYFYDVPNAKQSVFFFGYPAVTAMHADYFALQVMNYILGGGGFSSRFTQQLREGKGYTYGIFSDFIAGASFGFFAVRSGVRSNVTYEAAALVKEILQTYSSTYTEQDLEVTKSYLLKSGARAFETRAAKLEMLTNISAYHWPMDYVNQQRQQVKTMTLARIRELAGQYITPERMHCIIVGDAAMQARKISQLGWGEPVIINRGK